jgi:KDO2-lipid IV(A) lauroyltransferase
MALRHRIEYAAVAAWLAGSRLIPERMVYGLFNGLALLMYAVLTDRRRITLANLKIVFPALSDKERRRLAKKAYLNIADSLALNNLIITGRVSDEQILELVETEGWEEFQQRKAACKQGLLVFSGHIGNWELLPQWAGLRFEEQLHVIARRGDNQIIEQKIVLPLRKRFGMQVYFKKNALMNIVKSVRKGDICAMLIDQKLNPPEGFYIDFFGRPAPTGGSPALLQIRFGIAAQPAFLVKTAPHRHRLIFPEPVPWEDNGQPFEEQVKELSRRHQALLEEMIRKYPEQWLWMHNRWALPRSER